MQLSIIPSDNAVYKDGLGYLGITWGNTPDDVHALQWNGTTGHIEFIGHSKPNEIITVLPQWALNAEEAWQVAYDEANKPAPLEEN